MLIGICANCRVLCKWEKSETFHDDITMDAGGQWEWDMQPTCSFSPWLARPAEGGVTFMASRKDQAQRFRWIYFQTSTFQFSKAWNLLQIGQTSRRIGCVISCCKLQCVITQSILRLFWHICMWMKFAWYFLAEGRAGPLRNLADIFSSNENTLAIIEPLHLSPKL